MKTLERFSSILLRPFSILPFFRFNQLQPFVHLNSTLYETGVKLTQKEMDRLAQRFQRLPGLEKWFVLIPPLHSLVRV
ncbi:hypothetical protein KFU94_05770 [Chloroflexi bacterium TSY]|nr:hypothetical protein [Chloroflexi bacterium TSY]